MMRHKGKRKTAYLVLCDGTVYKGLSFGASGEISGEVVFNTSMTGYEEILTDPSYTGQLVTMTYPLIGNYGITNEDGESGKPWLRGFIVKESSQIYSNWRAKTDLETYLKENNIVSICGIDTRALTKRIRTKGAMEGVISTTDTSELSLIKKAKEVVGLTGQDMVKEVTVDKNYILPAKGSGTQTFHVAAYDFGIKKSIIENFTCLGMKVTVVPASCLASDVLSLNPDGIFLSNGPGDPEGVGYAISEVKKCIGKKPVFGICLGHQILCLALGAKTYKLKFGHHGANHPVKNLQTGKIEITAQNHSYNVAGDTLPEDVVPTHINLNDNTVEGIRHKKIPLFSVQYHPESSPGPHDSHYLFDEFVSLLSGKEIK